MTAAVAIPPSMPFPQLDAAVERVKSHAREFAQLGLDERIALMERVYRGYAEIAEESVRLACAAKGIDFGSPLAGEEWLAGPVITVRNFRLTLEALIEVKKYGAPRVDPKWIRDLPDGRLAIQIYPANGIDKALLAKHTGEVHLQPGITRENLKEHQAVFYRKPHGGKLCLVLGAGNVNSIPPTDVIYKMFVEGTACVLKMNPVNAYVGPLIERAFAPLVARGFFAVVYGEVAESVHLCEHPQVDEIHITGSDKTHDAIVWGTGPDGAARRAKNTPRLTKDITSELGNISPVIVVPGPWDTASLDFQARSVAGMVTNNASFNCNSAKLLLTSKGWDGRGRFLDGVSAHLASGPMRQAYYPGAQERWKAFTDGRAHVKLIGQQTPGALPYALITDVDLAKKDDKVFSVEPWCTVLSEAPIAASDPAAFLEEAVRVCNEQVWGTLCATILVHPSTLASPAGAAAVDKAIRALKYGSVAVNTWPAAVFGLGSLPWGGHPSSTLADIQSGRGWVHNTFMFEGLEKTVLHAPAKGFPISPWFPAHRTLDALAKAVLELEQGPSWLKVPKIAFNAMRG